MPDNKQLQKDFRDFANWYFKITGKVAVRDGLTFENFTTSPAYQAWQSSLTAGTQSWTPKVDISKPIPAGSMPQASGNTDEQLFQAWVRATYTPWAAAMILGSGTLSRYSRSQWDKWGRPESGEGTPSLPPGYVPPAAAASSEQWPVGYGQTGQGNFINPPTTTPTTGNIPTGPGELITKIQDGRTWQWMPSNGVTAGFWQDVGPATEAESPEEKAARLKLLQDQSNKIQYDQMNAINQQRLAEQNAARQNQSWEPNIGANQAAGWQAAINAKLASLTGAGDWITRWFAERMENPYNNPQVNAQREASQEAAVLQYKTIPELLAQQAGPDVWHSADESWGPATIMNSGVPNVPLNEYTGYDPNLQARISQTQNNWTNLVARADRPYVPQVIGGPSVASPLLASLLNVKRGSTLAPQGQLAPISTAAYGQVTPSEWQMIGGLLDYWNNSDLAKYQQVSESMNPLGRLNLPARYSPWIVRA